MSDSAVTRSYVHLGGERPLAGATIDEGFRATVSRHPQNEAVVSVPQGVRLTYVQLDDEVQRVARGLMAIGVEWGDRVGIWSTDNMEWIVVQLAAARIGAILVNINPAYRTHELAYALERVRLQTLIMIPRFRSSDYVAMVRELSPELDERRPDLLALERFPDLRRIVLYDPETRRAAERPASGFTTWKEMTSLGRSVADAAVSARARELDPDDVINIQFTSGTTGSPKAVMLTHLNVVNNALSLADVMRFTPEDRLCVPVPFYHCFGMVVSNLLCLLRGATVVIPSPHFEAGAVLRTLQDERCTALHGVPTMFVAELEHESFGRHDLSSLRTGIMAGAPCPPELVRRVIQDMGCREILIAYGMTESSPVTHCTRRDDSFERRVETVGTNLPHQEVKLVDPESGRIVPLGEQGEVCFRGYHVMRGYFGDRRATRQAIDELRWLHSGDLGVLDGNGYLRITGRLKDMIIRGGENIYPAEIEAFYFEHPKIAEVAVFGVPDQRMGEEVGAWIKLHEGETADPEELRKYAKGRIAHFKVPRFVWIVDEFPMTVTGKVQKFRIREIVKGWVAGGAPRETSGVSSGA